MTTEILTDRLILRSLNLQDAPKIFEIRSLEPVYKNIFTGPLKSVEAAEKWIRDTNAGPRTLMYTISRRSPLENEADAQGIIGVVGLTIWDMIHYVMHPKSWGCGYATEALKAFLTTMFELQPKRLSISGVVSGSNLGSRRVLEKCGFVPELSPNSVSMPTSAEILEQDELEKLERIVEKHPREDTMGFRYVKAVAN